MRSTKLLTAALLALTFTPAAWGDDPHGGYDRYDRYGQYRGDRYNSGRVADLARQLERTAASIHREFERNNRRPNRSEAQVAISLHELEQQAERFYRQAGGSSRQSSADRDFQRLLNAFYATEDSLRYIQPRGYVDRGMDQIGGILSELTRYYGRYDGYSRRRNAYRDNGRYDGRYDRDRRDGDRDGYRRPPQE